MYDSLIGYLLEALEVEEASFVEQMLESNEEVRSELEIMRLSLAPLQADRLPVDPPVELAIRTCQRIRQLHEKQAETG